MWIVCHTYIVQMMWWLINDFVHAGLRMLEGNNNVIQCFGFIISMILCQCNILGRPFSVHIGRNMQCVCVRVYSSRQLLSPYLFLPESHSTNKIKQARSHSLSHFGCHAIIRARTSAKSVLCSNLIERKNRKILECRCLRRDVMRYKMFMI